jgi:DNA-directed RNA polymerase beta subunit
MAETVRKYQWERVDFGKIKNIIDIPNLIEVQERSYLRFLQKDVPSRASFPSGTSMRRRRWSTCNIRSAIRSMT